jgi:hypothetical protein
VPRLQQWLDANLERIVRQVRTGHEGEQLANVRLTHLAHHLPEPLHRLRLRREAVILDARLHRRNSLSSMMHLHYEAAARAAI